VTDFYTRLEEQLVTAGHARAGRGPVRRAFAGRRPQLVAAVAVAALVAVVVAVLPPVLSSNEPAPAGPGHPTPAPLIKRNVRLDGITVTVLNGTTTPGMARDVAARLEARGAKIDVVADSPDQTLARTEIRWRGNADAKARKVAEALGVVRLGAANAEASVYDSNVVVFVGADGKNRGLLHVPGSTEVAAATIARVNGMRDVTCSPTRGAFAWTCTGTRNGRPWSCTASLQDRRPRGDLVIRCPPVRRRG
jgi:LytR cell envelope-related transcriptional attenuator